MTDDHDTGAADKRRPSGEEFGPPVSLRLSKAIDAKLDTWIAAQPEPRPTRPEAIQRILAQTLAPDDGGSIPLEELNASNDE